MTNNLSLSLKRNHSQASFVGVYMVIFIFIVAFCSKNEALTNKGVVVPFLNYNGVYFVLVLDILGIVYCAFKGSFRFDSIALLLLIRPILCIIPLLYIDAPSSYLGNLVVSVFPFLIYLFFYNSKNNISDISKYLVMFGVIIGIQCILAYLIIQQKSYANYFALFYKAYFVIPLGPTNIIAATILPLFILGERTIKNKTGRILYCALLIVSVLLTKSRTGIILLTIYIVNRLLKRENVNVKKYVSRMLLIVIPAFLVITVYIMQNQTVLTSIMTLLAGFTSGGSDTNLNGLFSGRFEIFGNVITHIFEYPIFGNGVTYEKMDMLRSHNIILQLLYENGILGGLIFGLFVYSSYMLIKKTKLINEYYRAFSIMVIYIFINAMVEEFMLSNPILIICLPFIACMKKELRIRREINV